MAKISQKQSNKRTSCGRIEAAPKSAETLPEPNHNHHTRRVNVAHITISENNQKLLAKEFLYLAGQDYDRAKETRLRRIRLARVYGLTNVEIGEELGITEAAVRAILRKDGDR